MVSSLSVDCLETSKHINANAIPEECTLTCNREELNETFTKLKKVFKATQVQASFLPRLASSPDFTLDDVVEEIERLGELAKGSKENLQQSKNSVLEAEQQVEQKVELLLKLIQEYSESDKVLKQKGEERLNIEKEIRPIFEKHSSSLPGLGSTENLNLNTLTAAVENAQVKLDDQLKTLQTENDRLSLFRRKVEDLQRKKQEKLAKLKEVEDKHQVQLENISALPSDKEAEAKQRVNELKQMHAWLSQMHSTISKLSGVRIGEVKGASMTVFFACGSEEYLVELTFNPDTTRLVGANVTPSTININDVLKEAIRSNDPRFLLREIRTRVFARTKLRDELAILRRSHALSWDELSREVVITLPAGVVCSFVLPKSYPEEGASAQITALDAFAASDQSKMDGILAMLQSESDHPSGVSLMNIVERVKTLVLN